MTQSKPAATRTPATPFCLFGLILLGFAAGGDREHALAESPSQLPTTWAILADDNLLVGSADLLTARLSGSTDFRLVERQEIRRVLQEQNLSATDLVSARHVIQVGKLLQADGLVLLNRVKSANGQPSIRVRAVDTGTSIRVFDTLVPFDDFDASIKSIADALINRAQTISMPSERVRYISVSRIVSGEPGHYLRGLCRTLNALVNEQFQQTVGLIVLEREDLQRLTAESDLSGIDNAFAAATRVLEASLRRSPNGEGYIASCRLTAPGQQERIEFEVVSDSADLRQLRNRLTRDVAKLLGTSTLPSNRSPEEEAALFETRARQFSGAYRPIEAAELMEAAYALAPNQNRMRTLRQHLNAALRQHDKTKNNLEAIQTARRLEELSLEQVLDYPSRHNFITRLTDGTVVEYRSGGSSLDSHFRKDTPEAKAIYADILDLRRTRYRTLFERSAKNPISRFNYQLRLIDIEIWSSTDPDRFDRATQMIRRLGSQLAEFSVSRSFSDSHYRDFLSRVLFQADRRFRPSGTSRPHSTESSAWTKPLESIDPTLGPIISQFFRVCGRPTRTTQADARKLLADIESLPTDAQRITGLDSVIRRPVVARIPIDEAIEFARQIVQDAKSESSLEPILQRGSSFAWLLRHRDVERLEDLANSIDELLPPDKPSRERNRILPIRVATQSVLLRLSVKRNGAPKRNESINLADAPGPWQDYVARPIPLTGISRSYNVFQVTVDRRADAASRGGRLLIAHGLPKGKLAVDRLPIRGGTPKRVGPEFPGGPVAFRGIQMASGDDAIYVASKAPGFVRLTADSFESFSEKQGAPSNDVWKLAWYRGTLFVAYADAFGSFHPGSKRFELLASSTSATAQNPLDAKGSFFVRTLIPDEENDCLWMTIQDNALPRDRNGMWRFRPSQNTDTGKEIFTKLSGGHVRMSQFENGFLLHRSLSDKVARMDPRTSEIQPLPMFYHAAKGPSFPTPHLIQVGDHLIGDNGMLFTADGQTHQLPMPTTQRWNCFQRLGPGFITHYDRDKQMIWYIEPKFR